MSETVAVDNEQAVTLEVETVTEVLIQAPSVEIVDVTATNAVAVQDSAVDVVDTSSFQIIEETTSSVEIISVGIQGPMGATGPRGLPGASGTGLIPLMAGANLAGHRAVINEREYADNTNFDHVGCVIGFTTAYSAVGEVVNVQPNGEMDGFAGLNPGPVYLSVNGTITQTIPTSGFIQQLGVAISSTSVAINIAPPELITQVSMGGTGVTSLTGIVKGNGTAPFGVAQSGEDLKTVNQKPILGSGNILIDKAEVGLSIVDNIDLAHWVGSRNLTTVGHVNALSLTTNKIELESVTITTSSGNAPTATTLLMEQVPIDMARSVDYIIQASNGSFFHVTRCMVLHDGTSVWVNEYSTIITTISLIEVEADISGGYLNLYVTCTYPNTGLKVLRTDINI